MKRASELKPSRKTRIHQQLELKTKMELTPPTGSTFEKLPNERLPRETRIQEQPTTKFEFTQPTGLTMENSPNEIPPQDTRTQYQLKTKSEFSQPTELSSEKLPNEITPRETRAQHQFTPRSDFTQRSPLERLPVEILQKIFFDCLEINLPKASPNLARSLSKPTIYSALVLFAYYEPSPAHDDIETHLFAPATYRRVTILERLRLQEVIHQCGWFTIDFFESCFPALSRLKMVDLWHQERQAYIKMREKHIRQKRRVTHYQNPDTFLPITENKSRMEDYFHARQQSSEGFSRLLRGPWPFQGPPGSMVENLIGPMTKDSYLPFLVTTTSWDNKGIPTRKEGRSILAVRTFPDRVLQGAPWTDAKVRILQFLRQGMRFESARQSNLGISLGSLYDGMGSAIVEGNEKALLVLLELHHTMVKFRAHSKKECRFSQLPCEYRLPLGLFHLACRVEASTSTRSKSAIMSLLLRGGIENVPPDDRILTRWATHLLNAESSTDEEILMTRWLLSCMEHVESHACMEYRPPGVLDFTRSIGYAIPRTMALTI